MIELDYIMCEHAKNDLDQFFSIRRNNMRKIMHYILTTFIQSVDPDSVLCMRADEAMKILQDQLDRNDYHQKAEDFYSDNFEPYEISEYLMWCYQKQIHLSMIQVTKLLTDVRFSASSKTDAPPDNAQMSNMHLADAFLNLQLWNNEMSAAQLSNFKSRLCSEISQRQLKRLIRFYSTPLGLKFITKGKEFENQSGFNAIFSQTLENYVDEKIVESEIALAKFSRRIKRQVKSLTKQISALVKQLNNVSQ